ncbi:hypothetical protein F2Q69_00047227 [Brassica cretica]|uniref:Xylanase inhibitor N-terminal domain-containing protein n=1 Tax=Brassica cretica TaxID=69181 RepID=A0A8S9PUG6_BRACR|nr:hypothetical protein F2Q69_00047227 [Brassica cretica]
MCFLQWLPSNTKGSSLTTPISFTDQRCSWGVMSSNSGCSAQNNICAYTQYEDGSGTSGFFVSDVLQFDIRLIKCSTFQCFLLASLEQ